MNNTTSTQTLTARIEELETLIVREYELRKLGYKTRAPRYFIHNVNANIRNWEQELHELKTSA